MQDYSLVPGGEHTAQAFQGLTFGGNGSGIGIGLGMLQQQQQATQTQGFQVQVPPRLDDPLCLPTFLHAYIPGFCRECPNALLPLPPPLSGTSFSAALQI